MKLLIIATSPRQDSLSLRSAFYLKNVLSTYPDIEATVADLKQWDTGFLGTTWKARTDVPEELRELWDLVNGASGLILVTPEYNGMFSPLLNATLDFFPKQAFHRKPFGIVAASTGGGGGMRAAMHLQQYVLGLFAYPVPQMLLIGDVDKRISPEGNSEDAILNRQAGNFLEEFLWLARKLKINQIA